LALCAFIVLYFRFWFACFGVVFFNFILLSGINYFEPDLILFGQGIDDFKEPGLSNSLMIHRDKLDQEGYSDSNNNININ